MVKVDPKIYDAYVGRYQLRPDLFVNVIREGDRLLVEFAGQPRLEVFPESETQFFVKNRDLQFRFVKDPRGNATQLILERSGGEEKAERVAKDEAKPKAAATATKHSRAGFDLDVDRPALDACDLAEVDLVGERDGIRHRASAKNRVAAGRVEADAPIIA